MHSPLQPSRSLYLAVALVAAAILGYEVALSRVFATILRYQFAFLVVALALCGLGLGGLVAHRFRRLSLEGVALFWGVSAALSLGVILLGVFARVPDQFWIAALLTLIPFGAGGTFLALVFARYGAWSGRIYGFDLAGAALAALGSVGVLQLLDAPSACLFFGALGALGAVFVAEKRGSALFVAVLLFALVPINLVLGVWSVSALPPLPDASGATLADRGVTQPLYTEIGEGKVGSKIIETRWNAFARTDVVRDPQAPNSLLLYTNGNVPTNMVRWNGEVASIGRIAADFPLADWVYANSNLSGERVLSIGPGGGLDALLALRYGAERFDGAEINPSIVGLMNEPRYREFNGNIYGHPKVHVEVAEGRAFVREARADGRKYQLIFSALTKTATAGQGAALLESYIYTRDAFEDYLSVLEDNGQVAVVGDAVPLLARLYATAFETLQARGLDAREAGQHVAVVFYPQPGPYQWALVVQKTPFSPAQTARMLASAQANNLFPLWIPGRTASNELFPFGSLGSGSLSLRAFVRSGLDLPGSPVALDLAPVGDNRPFVLDLAVSPFAIFTSSPSLSILLGLSVLATLALAAVLLFSGAKTAPSSGRTSSILTVGYFLALGIGFMLVEIPLIQKLALPLGYPTLALSVILFSILLGGGAGALYSQKFEGEKLRHHALFCAVGVVALALAYAFGIGFLSDFLLPLPLVARVVIVALVLLPLGFVLGTPFPAGLRLFGANHDQNSNQEALFWALNGTASVVGSIAAAVGSRGWGLSVVIIAGAVIYALVAVVLARKTA